MTMRRTRYSFDRAKTLFIILAITLLPLGLSFGLTSLQTSTNAASAQGRTVRVSNAIACLGGNTTVSVELDAQGNENAVSLNLSFNSQILTVVSVDPGTGTGGATFNTSGGGGGIGIDVSLPSGQTFPAGTVQLATITFTASTIAPAGSTPITINASSQVLDVAASPLPTSYVSGAINIRRPPLVSLLSPSRVNAGSPTTTVIIDGFNFVDPGTRVSLKLGNDINDKPLSIQSRTATRISVFVEANDLVTGGEHQIIISNPQPCGGQAIREFLVVNPTPAIASVAPNLTNVGSNAVPITITGSNFVRTSQVRYNGLPLASTAFVSPTQLTATIPADQFGRAGVANITVFNQIVSDGAGRPFGGGSSDPSPFTINNLVPTLTSLNPTSRLATDTGFTLTVNGTNFVSDSTVKWNGADRPTTFVSATQLTAAISAADIATAGMASVTASNPAPGGGASNALTFNVQPPPLVPVITSLSPGFAIVGGQQFTLTVNGNNFVANSVVRLNNTDRATTFGSATQLTASIAATDIATQGRVNITVFTPAPGGGTSNSVPLFVGGQFVSVSAASFKGGELADTSIAAGFGLNLANGLGFGTDTDPNTPGIQLPTALMGAKVVVRDSAGTERLAPLFFTSTQQLNYLMPAGTADGPAVMEVTNGDCNVNCKISVGGTQISRLAPGLFTASSDGLGIAAAVILRVKQPGNVQTFERMVEFNTAQNRFVTVPVDLGPATDNVFVVLFGTGFRFIPGLSSVSVTIGGMPAQVSFTGPQGALLGLDQCNVLIPRALISRGDADIVLTVSGKSANLGRMNIK
ncbi:MAG TPA: IPT/TIG domain-containing protein [Blastocatellia bacterium]|nr:IPT/TIG domain-containing protein [Blastocatellia bacterium]